MVEKIHCSIVIASSCHWTMSLERWKMHPLLTNIKFGREFLNYLKLHKVHFLDFLDMVLNIIGQTKAYFENCRIERTICYDIILMWCTLKKKTYNLFNTVMDVTGKTKVNPKVKMYIKEYCRRKDLWLHELLNGRIVKPKDSFIHIWWETWNLWFGY